MVANWARNTSKAQWFFNIGIGKEWIEIVGRHPVKEEDPEGPFAWIPEKKKKA